MSSPAALKSAPAKPLVQQMPDAGSAANEQADTDEQNDVRNPLWIVALGMACLFGAMAAVIAFTGFN